MKPQHLVTGVVLFAAAALAAWLYLQLTPQAPRRNALPGGIDYRASGIVLTQYGHSGRPRYRLDAARLAHTVPDDITHLYTLTLTLFPATGAPVVLKTARAELLADGEHVSMPDTVRIRRRDARGEIRLTTARVMVDIPRQTATSAAPTRITGPGFEVSGLGMQADFADHVFTLLHDVNSTYRPGAP